MNSRLLRQQQTNHRPPIIDIRAKKEGSYLGRPRDQYEIGALTYDIDRIASYVYVPEEWHALFAHAPCNPRLSYSFQEDGEAKDFAATYFKGTDFSLPSMLACMALHTSAHTTTYQSLNTKAKTSVSGPLWTDQTVRTFMKLAYLGRKVDFSVLGVHDLLKSLSPSANSDEYLRALFQLALIAKTQLKIEGPHSLPQTPLFSVLHQSGESLFAKLYQARAELAPSSIKQLCKESVLQFGNAALGLSFADCLAINASTQKITYQRHMVRLYDPDTQISLNALPEFLKDVALQSNEDESGYAGKVDLSVLRLLSLFTGYAPSAQVGGGGSHLQKTFQLEAIAALAGKRAELINDKALFVRRTLALVSAFIGRITMQLDNLVVRYGIVSKGMSFERMKEAMHGLVAEIKKITEKAANSKLGAFFRKRQTFALDEQPSSPPRSASTSHKAVAGIQQRFSEIIKSGRYSQDEISQLRSLVPGSLPA